MTVADYTRVLINLELQREHGFITVRALDLPRPMYADKVSRLTTSRDLLRAWLHHQMHRALSGGCMEPGLYRVVYDGERVADLWTGKAMAGCGDQPAHVRDCGLFACPARHS